MARKIRLKSHSESLTSQASGVPYHVDGFGTLRIRRGGLKDFKQALRDATDEVLGMDCNHNYISFEHEQAINCKVVANYTVVKLEDDCVDYDGNKLVSSVSMLRAIFENPENYSLVLELIEASHQFERFLLSTLAEECEELKKS